MPLAPGLAGSSGALPAGIKYLQERRKQLGGYMPARKVRAAALPAPKDEIFEEFYKGTEGRKASSTMVFVRLLGKLHLNRSRRHRERWNNR